jgi:glycosyltransferase involved in cell wall biosynthesis
MPMVSVIIPVFRAKSTLERALLSVKAQGWPEKDIEIVLSIDDGENYNWAKKYGSHIKLCYGLAPATGAGPARNRGILAASGQFLAFLDADDQWANGYLDALYPAAKTYGLAFGQTVIHAHDGSRLMRLGDAADQNNPQLKIDDFGHWPGSFHPLMRRQITPYFLNQPAQDVFHAIESMAAIGQQAPLVAAARYQLNLNTESVTASAGFSHRLDRSYRQMGQLVLSGQTQVPRASQHRVIRALQNRRNWNQRFMRDGHDYPSFYHFLADSIA